MRLLLALLLLTASPAASLDWVLSQEGSTLAFTYTENGAEMAGRFPVFTGTAFYDPELPEGSEVEVIVRTEAVALADPVRTLFAKTKSWFDTDTHPEARFTLTLLEKVSETELNAKGTLQVKERVVPVALPVTLVAEGGCLRASGALEMALADYDIGDDAFTRFIRVGETVRLTFDLLGQRRGRSGPC